MERLITGDIPVVTGPSWKGVRYFCTQRSGGVSTGAFASLNLGLHVGDERQHVLENRSRLEHLAPGPILWLNQVHGTEVFDADLGDILSDSKRPEKSELLDSRQSSDGQQSSPSADAAITTRPYQTLCIMSADCLPVVIADTEGRTLAVAHAGWRGLAAGVLENALEALRQRLPHAAWQAWLGPAISQEHFEVGAEVFQAFVRQDDGAAEHFYARNDKYMASLPNLAKRRLNRAGVTAIFNSNECTFARQDRYFSYRRDGETGRMATLAWLEPDPGKAQPTDGHP